MSILSTVLISLVALAHFYFFYLESFLWTKPKGLAVFKMTAEQAQSSAVLAANQGLYNGLLALGLVMTFFLDDASAYAIRVFVLSFLVVAGIYGAATVSRRIFFVQSLPAILALASLVCGTCIRTHS